MEQVGYNNIHLAIMAIEKGAKIMNVPSKNMYMRLKKQGLIHNFLCHIMKNYIPRVLIGLQELRLKHSKTGRWHNEIIPWIIHENRISRNQ